VNLHGADDAADGAGANAPAADGFDGGAAELGMSGEAEIVVGAEVDDLFTVNHGDGLLFTFEDAQAGIEVLGLQVFESGVQIMKLRTGGGGHGPSSGGIG
jgi:hypothetical protein